MIRVDVNVAAAAVGGRVVSLHVHLGHARVLLHKGLHLAVEGSSRPSGRAKALLGAALWPCVDEAVTLEAVVSLNMLGHLPERIRSRALGAAAQEGSHDCGCLCEWTGLGEGSLVAIVRCRSRLSVEAKAR